MNDERRSSVDAPASAEPVRLFRIREGETHLVLSLSPQYGGMFTHFHKGMSKYCRGNACRAELHKLDRNWKGFAAVLVYRDVVKAWFPAVLEITAAAELDLRGRWTRGQVWEFKCPPKRGKKHYPASCRLTGTAELDRLPPAFDYRAVLLHLFNEEVLDLDARNPLPPHVLAASVTHGAWLGVKKLKDS
jgi:hypothetical protein